LQNSCILPSGPTCPACGKPLLTPSLVVQLEVQIRAFIGRYYEAWMSCNDQTCELRTRMMSVYGRRCLRPECPGTASFEVRGLCLFLDTDQADLGSSIRI
jgi:DNA polymerase alpha subunit A